MVVGQLPRTTALKENCPLDNFPQIIASGKLPQRQFPPDNIPQEIAPAENCLSDDFSPILLSLGQMVSGKLPPGN